MSIHKRVAVVTDAVSPDFYFPLWHKYYGASFGEDNLFVVQFGAAAGADFSPWRLGGIRQVPTYNNSERATYISSFVSELLIKYDYVVRIDVDEILVPNPKLYSSLRDYVNDLDSRHVTAFGYNIIQAKDEKEIKFDIPILCHQRRYAYAYDALNKTCIVSADTRWLPGFHSSNRPVAFNNLFLFHMKLADIDIQLAIGRSVADLSDEDTARDYHLTPREVLMLRNTEFLNRTAIVGFDNFMREDYERNFVAKLSNVGEFYHPGPFMPEYELLEIPTEFSGLF